MVCTNLSGTGPGEGPRAAAERVWVEASTKNMMAHSALKTLTLFSCGVNRNPLSEFVSFYCITKKPDYQYPVTDAINTFSLHLQEDGILHFEGSHHILRIQENQDTIIRKC